uniref:CSON001927 protein n=1 Tax=Culicoides sonorensis TaxID=179676 RepID=A0A336MVJ2_CULSO
MATNKLLEEGTSNTSTNVTPSRSLLPRQKPPSLWTPLLITTGISTTFGASIACGYNIGVINSPGKYIKHWCNETLYEQYEIKISHDMLETLWASIVSIFLIGGAIGSLSGAWVSNKLGRKKAFFGCSMLYIFGGLCFQFCRTFSLVELLVIGRLAVGLASGLTTSTIPMYLSEIAPLELRGTFGVLCSMGVTGGVVVGQVFSLAEVFGTEDLWQFALSCYTVIVILCLLPYIWLPESPKFLYLIANKRDDAEQELIKLRTTHEHIKAEIDAMNPNNRANISEKRSLCSVIRDPKLLLPLVLVCALQGGQQMSGINAVFYYSVQLFESIGFSQKKAQFANLGAGCINLFVAFLSPILMQKVNRRPLAFLSISMSAVFLFVLTLAIQFIDSVSWFAYACIAAVFLYIFFYQLGLGPIPFFIAAELFEVGPRPVAMALGSLSSWTCNFIVGQFFPILNAKWGAFVFLPFAITCVLLSVLVYFYLPETRNQDPSIVAPKVSKGFKSKIQRN